MMLKRRENFNNLKLGQKIYSSEGSQIKSYYFAGFSPIGEYVMLINGDCVSKMTTIYIPNLSSHKFTNNYEEAKIMMLKYLNKRLESAKKIYFKGWKESDWRDFNLNEILE